MTSYLITLLFIKANLINFTLDVLRWSGTHYMLVDSKQNRYLYFLIAKQPCKVAAKLSEVWVGILNNNIISISNDLQIDGEYGMSSRKENRKFFLDSCAQFVKNFYSDTSKMLKANECV